jgi:hypothetical protein
MEEMQKMKEIYPPMTQGCDYCYQEPVKTGTRIGSNERRTGNRKARRAAEREERRGKKQ